MDELVCPGCVALRRELDELRAQVADLTRKLHEALRAGKRQAAPFRKGPLSLSKISSACVLSMFPHWPRVARRQFDCHQKAIPASRLHGDWLAQTTLAQGTWQEEGTGAGWTVGGRGDGPLGRVFGLSEARVRQMRREFRDNWEEFHADHARECVMG